MTAPLNTSRAFEVPEVSQAEIDSFHDAHFSSTAVELFEAQFLTPANAPDNQEYYEEYYREGYEGGEGEGEGEGEEDEDEEEDDGLGYYPDGVKRTLTDEQIAIFRHSEIEALRRNQARADNIKEDSTAAAPQAIDHRSAIVDEEQEDGGGPLRAGSEDGELESEQPTAAELKHRKKRRAKQAKKERKKYHPEPKEDLRKRTWDKVEAGMDSLDYDGLETAQNTASGHAAKRRRISYDD